MEEIKPKYRIGTAGIVFWVALAALADLFSLIPFVGDIVGPIFWICASIYLWKVGCGLLNARRLATSLISMVAEMIPIVQEFPLILAGMIAVIVMVRAEDKTGISVPGIGGKKTGSSLVQNGVNPPHQQQIPLNQGGVRAPSGGLQSNK